MSGLYIKDGTGEYPLLETNSKLSSTGFIHNRDIALPYGGIEQCTVNGVHTVYSSQCTVHIVQCTVHSVQFTVYSSQCTVYSTQCAEKKKGTSSNPEHGKIYGFQPGTYIISFEDPTPRPPPSPFLPVRILNIY